MSIKCFRTEAAISQNKKTAKKQSAVTAASSRKRKKTEQGIYRVSAQQPSACLPDAQTQLFSSESVRCSGCLQIDRLQAADNGYRAPRDKVAISVVCLCVPT